MIDWNQPELTKEAVVREAGCYLTQRNAAIWDSWQSRAAWIAGGSRQPIMHPGYLGKDFDSAYEHPTVQSYVAAHRTQEALDENESCARGWHEACTRTQCPCECHKKVAPECQCGPGICPVLFGFPRPAGKRCKQSGTQEAPAEAQEQAEYSPEHITLLDALTARAKDVSIDPTQPTHSAAELPQWVADLNENSKLDTYHFVGSEVRQLVGEITKGQRALNAANAQIAELEKLLAAHKGISEGKSDVVKQLEARNGK